MPRDDFSPRTRLILGERAAYICTNPDCRDNTIGPHSDPDKSLDTGIAAHICAAAPGGPRYDPTQTPEERQSITNGIWLCARCSKILDTDEKIYPAELLRGWRSEHEQWISGRGMIPKLPELKMEDLEGLSLLNGPTVVTAEDCQRFRERRIILKNTNRVPLFQFDFRIQLPEPLVKNPQRVVPPGVNIQFKPERQQFVATASGAGASATLTGQPNPNPNAILKVDCLPAQQEICLSIYTIVDPLEDVPLPSLESLPDNPTPLPYYLSGEYFFDYRNERVRRRILVPLLYDKASRRVDSLSPQSDDAPYFPLVTWRWP
jgi:hypothetical protein